MWFEGRDGAGGAGDNCGFLVVDVFGCDENRFDCDESGARKTLKQALASLAVPYRMSMCDQR